RRGTLADSHTAFTIFARAVEDFTRRTYPQISPREGETLAGWAQEQALFEHLASTADEFWIAEEGGATGSTGAAIGYARSIRRDDMRELTEFFVLPGNQSAGVGRELLARAFPAEGVSHRSIIATTDPRAQSRYLRAGVNPHFPIYYFGRKPQTALEPTDL